MLESSPLNLNDFFLISKRKKQNLFYLFLRIFFISLMHRTTYIWINDFSFKCVCVCMSVCIKRLRAYLYLFLICICILYSCVSVCKCACTRTLINFLQKIKKMNFSYCTIFFISLNSTVLLPVPVCYYVYMYALLVLYPPHTARMSLPSNVGCEMLRVGVNGCV